MQDHAGNTPPCTRNPMREGLALGVLVAAITWAWVAAVDAISGRPLHTFDVLGGVFAFTGVHIGLNLVLGIVLVGAMHSALRAPTVFIGVIFSMIMLEVGFAMVTPLLAEFGMGNHAWVAIFAGSLVGLATMLLYVSRRHPLGEYLERAEAEH